MLSHRSGESKKRHKITPHPTRELLNDPQGGAQRLENFGQGPGWDWSRAGINWSGKMERAKKGKIQLKTIKIFLSDTKFSAGQAISGPFSANFGHLGTMTKQSSTFQTALQASGQDLKIVDGGQGGLTGAGKILLAGWTPLSSRGWGHPRPGGPRHHKKTINNN